VKKYSGRKSEKISWGVQFFRQFPMLDYVVDFYCKEIGLAIEIDGSSHHNRFLEDNHRQGRIEELGVYFIRFTNKQVLDDIDGILKKLDEVIADLEQG